MSQWGQSVQSACAASGVSLSRHCDYCKQPHTFHPSCMSAAKAVSPAILDMDFNDTKGEMTPEEAAIRASYRIGAWGKLDWLSA